MRAEDLSRGHWLVLAILVGTAIGWLESNTGEVNANQTHSRLDFENTLVRPPVTDKQGRQYPWIKAVTIYPAMETGFQVRTPQGKSRARKSIVSFQALAPVPSKGWTYKSGTILANDPYEPVRNPSATPGRPFQDYIKGLAADHPWIQYRYAWWREARWCYALWLGGCVVAIGIIWPSVLNRLVRAGYGHKSEPDEKKESFLKRFFTRSRKASASQSVPGKASPATLSQNELDRINQMEAGLQDFIADSKAPGGQVVANPGPAILPLNAAPLEASTEQPKPDEKKEYGGEFYPTVAHARKKEQ
jgi:hypothetical protein